MYFDDRADAGRQLAEALGHYRGRPDLLVLALPRGGVPVAFEVSRILGAPLDVLVVRKLGVPGHPELAMGAVVAGSTRVVNTDVVAAHGIPDHVIDRVAASEQSELKRRERAYRGTHPPPDIRGKTVILVDDGLATGSTMRAAAESVRQQAPSRLVAAVPAAAPQVCDDLRDAVDEMICLITPEPFHAVGLWYTDFSQTTDDEVRDLLARASLVSS
jgi:predicted phosphoribosyltransferase